MRAGVHVSVKNGFTGAVREAQALGCDAFQIFTQSPRGWRGRIFTDEEFIAFRKAVTDAALGPVVVHGSYLPNLCTSDEELYARSLAFFHTDVDRAEKLGAAFFVIHPGAFSEGGSREEGMRRFADAANAVLARHPGQVTLLIENMAGGGRRIGGPFSEIAALLALIHDRSRVGVCFDTCHAFAAGYDVANPDGRARMWEEFDRLIGLDAIKMFHVNDSKGALGSHLDRHEHLGRGGVGLAAMGDLLRFDPRFSDLTFILETPKDTPAADPENLRLLRGLFAPAPSPALR